MDHFPKRTTELKLSVSTNTNLQSSASFAVSSDIMKKHKTPVKTPLKLCTSTKKTPHTKTNDRYIPNRVSSNMEVGYHLLTHNKDSQQDIENIHLYDHVKRKLISDTCTGSSTNDNKEKVLSLHSRVGGDNVEQAFADNLKSMFNASACMNTSLKKSANRHVITQPEKILDAPEFKDDFYLNLIDWSTTNNLAVALNKDVYIWNATTKEISQLFTMDQNTDEHITSVSWIQKGNVLAVGNSKNCVELWDVQKQACLRQMKTTHNSRISSLSWNKHILSAGSRSGEINHNDVRVAQHRVGTLNFHTQEICGLKWSHDGRHLASGANDNLVGIWDANFTNDSNQPLHVFKEHTAAVKAVSWCPWQNNVLATGGGTADGYIRIWNVYNGNVLHSVNANSQISSLLWSKNYKELISSHGHPNNQLSIWKFSDMSKVCELNGHTNRVLALAMSPDEDTVASIGADETLRFWKCFMMDDRFKKSNNSTLSDSMHTSLSRSIR